MKNFLMTVFIFITAINIVSCKEEPNEKTVLVTGVKLNKSEIALVLINDTEQLTATILPENATNQEVVWNSSDENVAVVDDNGLVTAKGEGECKITVTTDDFGYTANCEVTVFEQPVEVIDVIGISLEESEVTLNIGDTKELKFTVEPENATKKNVTWTTSDYTIATVDENGVVTAHAKGETQICVTTVNGAFQDCCIITVSAPVTNVSFRMNEVEMILGDTQMLTATVFPLDAVNRNVRWNSSNTGVAEVDDNGLLTARSIGTTVISVTTEERAKMATILVKVVPTPPYSEFVKTYGSKFILEGQEIVFKGAGQWPGARWNSNTYQKLASIGFNSVRLYINASNSTLENPGNFSPGFSEIDNQIQLAKENNMTIILNVHHSPGSGGQISDRNFFTNTDYQERLGNFWKTIAERYKNEPTIAGFDLYNEPTVRVNNVGGTGAPYNCNGTPYLHHFIHYQEIMQSIVDVIREVNMNHIIIVERLWLDGGHYSFAQHDQRDCWQNFDGKFNFPDINDPANNYAYTYHCYEPNTYCHQTLSNPPRNAMYPSSTIARHNEGPDGIPPWRYSKEYLDYAYTLPMPYIREVKNVPVYIGELGIHEGNYLNNRGGAQYIEDLYDVLLNSYKLSSSFHPYHIGEFHPNINANHESALRKAFGTN